MSRESASLYQNAKNNTSSVRHKIIIMKLQRKSLKRPAKYLPHSFHRPDSRTDDDSSMLHQADDECRRLQVHELLNCFM